MDRSNIKTKNPSAVAIVLLCVILVGVAGCSRSADKNTVVCNNDMYSAYPELAAIMLPQYTVKTDKNLAFEYLANGFVTEAYDAQARSSVEAGLAEYWYPQYLATVVIAVDRDRTSAQIKSWSDLAGAYEEVGFNTDNVSYELLTAAIAYGLQGEKFSLDSMIGLLSGLHDGGRLVQNSFDTPLVICFDYQAAVLKKSGRNIEIIIPAEGTLTYEKGLLSKTELSFPPDAGQILFDAGFRLLDGTGDAELYPDTEDYDNAVKITDYSHLNTVVQDSFRAFRREVLHARRLSSVDGREHQLFVMLYIIIVAAWTASFIHRLMQKDMRRAVLLTGTILAGWIMVRLIKYQIPPASDLNRYFWYSYYLFQLSLPLVIFWLSWIIDKPDGDKPTRWMCFTAGIYLVLMAFVMTNDLHNLVFRLDLSDPNWHSEYGYGVLYYVILTACLLPVALAIGTMILKGRQGLRKKGIMLPIALVLLMAAYSVGYITRIPLAWESDFTMMIGLFTLLFVETAIRAGMIPVNSKFTALFTHSSLGMRIIDSDGDIVRTSDSALQYPEDEFKRALFSYPLPIHYDENTLLFATTIIGGHVLWQEDVSDLNRLHLETEESIKKIEAANAVLAEEGRTKRAIDTENSRTVLMTQLETEIASYTIRLSTMIEQLENMVDRSRATARIALLLCYIKRRCNLFFRERETEVLLPDELKVYFDEMEEFAAYSDVRVIVASMLNTGISVRRATLMYDFFYNIVYWATWRGGANILAHFSSQSGNTVLRLLLPEDASSFQMEKSLEKAIGSAGGRVDAKPLDDDAIGLSLSFPEGGNGYD